jgi:hypothetical protein
MAAVALALALVCTNPRRTVKAARIETTVFGRVVATLCFCLMLSIAVAVFGRLV